MYTSTCIPREPSPRLGETSKQLGNPRIHDAWGVFGRRDVCNAEFRLLDLGLPLARTGVRFRFKDFRIFG